jgi:hypothetical protein
MIEIAYLCLTFLNTVIKKLSLRQARFNCLIGPKGDPSCYYATQ